MAFLGCEPVTRAALAASLTVTSNASTSPAAGDGAIGTEFGFRAMIAVPCVTVEVTVYEPAKTDWVVSMPFSPATTSTASVMRPDPVLIRDALRSPCPRRCSG